MTRSLIRKRTGVALGALLAIGLLAAAPVAAQENFNFNAGFTLGLGGAFDAEPDPGLDNDVWQAIFSWRTQPKTQVGIRFGEISYDGEIVGALVEPTLTYITIAGEYRFRETYYTSGVFLGLGLYDIDGAFTSDEGIGLTAGVTGDIPLSPRLSILIEVAGHFADLEDSELFGTIQGGLTVNF